ncbi:MAG: putative glutamine ABC transporter permease protein GlnM [Alphaproteobacteria bacterium MarineAlpha5_Bin12]|nr:MAG: putative glutamine ABC transporter permease protein GlnM [Alphaproteobacteria bacterium MarineAlpha5_Bin12]|tara:strand:- start:727 stop:1923 length:1197 start_codon:yes stop_codon:yes gene_type:complete
MNTNTNINIIKPPKEDLFKSGKFRSFLIQSIVMILVISFITWVVNNTATNMTANGIAHGFDFLWETSWFDIGYLPFIDHTGSSTYFNAFIVGILNTILVALLGIFFATILGFLIGIGRLSDNWLVSTFCGSYIEVIRNVPLLLQIFFWYHAVLRILPRAKNSLNIGDSFFLNLKGLFIPKPIPETGFNSVLLIGILSIIAIIITSIWAKRRQNLTGKQFPMFITSLLILIIPVFIISYLNDFPMFWEQPVLKGFNFKGGFRLIPELVALLLALSMYTAAFIAENVRSGILAISKGQREAAAAVGLTNSQILRLIVIPQAMRVIIPPLTSQYLNLTKNSSLAVAIAYPDLVHVFAGTALMQTGQAVEILAMTMSVYLTLSLLISLLMNWYNSAMALKDR